MSRGIRQAVAIQHGSLILNSTYSKYMLLTLTSNLTVEVPSGYLCSTANMDSQNVDYYIIILFILNILCDL